MLEREPIVVQGRAIAYRTDSREFMIRSLLPAPVTGEVLIPVEVGKAPESAVYGVRATASIPKIAGAYGSLVYLGLRFGKGIFSVACPRERLQSCVTNTFADGTILASGTLLTC
jgi:hypothetical protein